MERFLHAGSVQEAMRTLTPRRPVFHSEANIQHELALQLRVQHPNIELRLERPFYLGNKRAQADIVLVDGGHSYVIELKYIRARLEVTLHGERFQLCQEAAHGYEGVSGGMVVALTNEPSMMAGGGEATVDRDFRLAPGRQLSGELTWASHASDGTKGNRPAVIALANSYVVHWRPYSSLPDVTKGTFSYLAFEVPPLGSQPQSLIRKVKSGREAVFAALDSRHRLSVGAARVGSPHLAASFESARHGTCGTLEENRLTSIHPVLPVSPSPYQEPHLW